MIRKRVTVPLKNDFQMLARNTWDVSMNMRWLAIFRHIDNLKFYDDETV